MQIFLASTQGFCAGVARAINIVETALAKYGTPLYVYHEIVHNTAVVESFRERGVSFVEDIHDIPKGAICIFSAHGVPPQLIEDAKNKGLRVIDATCPLVTKVHLEAQRLSKQNIPVILIGHKGHQELIGTSGFIDPKLLHIVETKQDIDKLTIPAHQKTGFITQTTLSVDDARELILKLRARYPNLTGPTKDDICYATQNRQDAIKELAQNVDVIIICGSPKSSNANRLREKGEQLGRPSHIIDDVNELNYGWLAGKQKVGISSGASVPRRIIDELVTTLQNRYPGSSVQRFDNPEKNVVFPLPQI